jgi:Cellulase (glycosyl hydrolase family 5)
MGGLLGCSLVALLLAGSGLGSPGVETTIQDDATLLHRSEADVRQAARQIAELGADRVRLTAGWSVLAPSPRKRRRPGAPFDARNSKTYPEAGFDALDRAVRAIDAAGLKVQIDIAFWAPRWAVAKRSPNPARQRYIPRPRAFADFAYAVAQRYSGRFPDPHRTGRDLPAVRMYTTWNEPNHVSFLSPQWRKDASAPDGYRPYSPHVYRAMHEAAYDEIKAVSDKDVVLIGGLSSFGSTVPGKGAVPPLQFLRTMACVDGAMQPLQVPECAGAGPLRADGLALHPYSVGVAPGVSAPNADDVYLADLGRVTPLLTQLHDAGRINETWPLYLTEYGYDTADFAQTPETQAAYQGWSTFLAQRDPNVRMFAQFLLRDIPDGRPRPYTRSGLLYADGRPKPAAQAFKIPLYGTYAVGPDGQPALVLYGGVRPGDGRKTVRVERRDEAADRWVPVRTTGTTCDEADAAFLTEGSGFFTRTAAWDGPGTYRLGWLHGGGWEHGAEIPVDQLLPGTGR